MMNEPIATAVSYDIEGVRVWQKGVGSVDGLSKRAQQICCPLQRSGTGPVVGAF